MDTAIATIMAYYEDVTNNFKSSPKTSCKSMPSSPPPNDNTTAPLKSTCLSRRGSIIKSLTIRPSQLFWQKCTFRCLWRVGMRSIIKFHGFVLWATMVCTKRPKTVWNLFKQAAVVKYLPWEFKISLVEFTWLIHKNVYVNT